MESTAVIIKERGHVRHGDCALIAIESLPDGLKASPSRVLMTGSGGNNHEFTGPGTFYPHDERQGDILIAGYFVPEAGVLLVHPDHGADRGKDRLKEAPIDPGIYQVRKQIEQTHAGLQPVED